VRVARRQLAHGALADAVIDKDGLTPGLAEIIDPSQTYRLR